MNAMTVTGRRAEIAWGKKGRQYDTFLVKLGLVVPFVLGELLHIWDIPLTSLGACKAIKLRPDPVLKRRVLLSDWAIMSGIGLLIGCPFLWTKVDVFLGVASLILGLVLGVVGVVLWQESPRHRKIRLVLGPHSWGSSDPATWSKSIRRDLVDPKEAFQVKSFATLAKKAITDEDWCLAMWAARLCAAVEKTETGEELTDTILAEDDVQDRLAQVRRRPDEHRQEFGKPPPLRQWLKCDPATHILEIS